jgi:hypothetical protein
VKYEWEAQIPKCEDICGIFRMNIILFIEGCIRERVRPISRSEIEDIAEDMFKEFSLSIYSKIIEKEVGEVNAE